MILNILEVIGKNTVYIYILHFIGIYYIENSDKTLLNGVIGVFLALICPMIGIKIVDFINCVKRKTNFME